MDLKAVGRREDQGNRPMPNLSQNGNPMLSHGDVPCPEPPPNRRGGPKATREQLSMAGQIAALTRWSREDPGPQVQRLLDGQMAKFRREVLEHDPDVVEPELTRRAECARKAHMRRLALLSSKARAKNRGAAA